MFEPSALPACFPEFLFGDCVPFLKRETPVTAQQIFDALPSREELQYSLKGDSAETPYIASDRSRWDSPEFYAMAMSFMRSLKIQQSVGAAFSRPGFEKDFQIIASTTAKDFTEAALHSSMPRSNEALMMTAENQRLRTALSHLRFSTATVPLTDGNKMRLHHFGCAMNRVFGALTVFHTHNYADNYSPEVLKLQSSQPSLQSRLVELRKNKFNQNIVMPTLQEMHRRTAASPRTTAKLFLLMEELSYRFLYRVDRVWLGNFNIASATSFFGKEDDYASSGLRGLADFVTAVFKVIEAQARGFSHGHGKTHSIPDATQDLLRVLEETIAEIETIEATGDGKYLAEERVKEIADKNKNAHNQKLIASASTRQYECVTAPAKQLGNVLPAAPFSEKQQRQSRYDGALEDDGVSKRPYIPVQPAEPLAHIAQDRRKTDCEHQLRRNAYNEVRLTGCQLCTAPHYLLPHSFGQRFDIGDEGETEDADELQLGPLPWRFDSVTGELQHFVTSSKEGCKEEVAQAFDFEQDAKVFEQCFGKDVRYLHHHNHDHDCSSTCVKNVKKKTQEELAKMLKANRAPPCRFEFWHVVEMQVLNKTKRVRRRGKELVQVPFISNATDRNRFGSVALERQHPFTSASSDCGLATMRCNNDFRYMVKGFPLDADLEKAFRCDASQLAACFRSMKAAIKAHSEIRRMAMTIVALHVQGNIVDYYITKYSAKPMEQLQNLVTQYALGLRRLEAEEAAEAEEEKQRKNEEECANDSADKDLSKSKGFGGKAGSTRARARRVLLRLQYSANRSKWISSTEAAIYVHTEQQHWTSHHEVPAFLTRPTWIMWECKRCLSDAKRVTKIDLSIQSDSRGHQITYAVKPKPLASDGSAVTTSNRIASAFSDGSHLAEATLLHATPKALHNIGSTCYMNALLQCCRQILARVPATCKPDSDTCPLSLPLRHQYFTSDEVRSWRCWQYLPLERQRDPVEVLNLCFNPQSQMHQSCNAESCYGALLQRLTSFRTETEFKCQGCEHNYFENIENFLLAVELVIKKHSKLYHMENSIMCHEMEMLLNQNCFS